jgi:hypothetical protein
MDGFCCCRCVLVMDVRVFFLFWVWQKYKQATFGSFFLSVVFFPKYVVVLHVLFFEYCFVLFFSFSVKSFGRTKHIHCYVVAVIITTVFFSWFLFCLFFVCLCDLLFFQFNCYFFSFDSNVLFVCCMFYSFFLFFCGLLFVFVFLVSTR